MASGERLSFGVPKNYGTSEVIVVDGFGQPPGDRVTHDIPPALIDAFPGVVADAPISTAETLEPDTTLQLSFSEQAEKVRTALETSSRPVNVVAYSQGGIAVAEVLATEKFDNVESVMFIGTPISTEGERRRIERLAAHESGESFGYVYDQVSFEMADKALQGVVRFQPKGSPRSRYVGITEEYMDSFPTTTQHFSNLHGVANSYRTTLVSAGAEDVTDCTPETARQIGKVLDMPFTDDFRNLDWAEPRQGFVIPNANHRLGSKNRRETLPRIFGLRNEMAYRALAVTMTS